jgi:6-phosphogluconolactonase (cycloisomerase 2 family)
VKETDTDRLIALSRRTLMAGAGAALTARQASSQMSSSGTLAYVGTVTGNGRGIHLFRVNPSNGALTQIKVAAQVPSPTWLEFDPTGKFLYSTNAIANFNGTPNGSVSAFTVDRSNGDLKLINSVNSEGGGPTHLDVDPTGKFVLVANYGGGTVAVLPIRSDGSLGAATDVKRHEGPIGPLNAALGPVGSFAISGHDAPHPHMIMTDPAGKYAFSPDLGTDRIFIWKFDAENGKLTPNDQPYVQAVAGAGPRHFIFHPNGRWMYSINEEDSTVTFFVYDASKGMLQPRRTISALPDGYTGTNFTSGIIISPDGKYVYGLNRLHNTIATFEVDQASGDITLIGQEWTRGDYPRHLTIDPAGKFMYVLNQRADNIATFSIQEGGRKLVFANQFTPVGAPQRMLFL